MKPSLTTLVIVLGVISTGIVRAEPGIGTRSLATPSVDAQVPVSSTAPDAGSDRADLATSEREGNSAKLYEEAESRYQAGDLQAARGLMEEAYRLSRRPELLFNLGHLERKLQRCPVALAYYRQYLEQASGGTRRAEAAQALKELSAECPDQPATAPSKPPERRRPFVPRPYWTMPRAMGWGAIAAGVLAGGGALYFQLSAGSEERKYENLQREAANNRTTFDQSRGRQIQDDGQADARFARFLTVAATSLLAGGAVLVLLGSPHAEQPRQPISVAVQPGLAEVVYWQSF